MIDGRPPFKPDIVRRLRDVASGDLDRWWLCNAAADEIEYLRAQLAILKRSRPKAMPTLVDDR
jgi:hypothetical protein